MQPEPHDSSATKPRHQPGLRRFFGLTRYLWQAFALVWQTDRWLCIGLVTLTLVSGLMPAAIAYVGKLIIDGVTRAIATHAEEQRHAVLVLVSIELLLVATLVGLQRGLAVCDALLRVRLAQRVIELVLGKALKLALADFEDANVYDTLKQAREQATDRPLSLVRRGVLALQLVVTLLGYLLLLAAFSKWIMLLLLLAALPVVVAEARFNADAFRLFRAHSPEARRQAYLETILTREDHVKEVKLLGIGPTIVDRHRRIFSKWYAQDRALSMRRGVWGFGLALIAAAALAASYAWVAWQAMAQAISIGALAMLFGVLRQAQSSATEFLMVVAGMYDDNLYINTLHDFLGYPTREPVASRSSGPLPGDGLRFEAVEFSYPGAKAPALSEIDLHLTAGKKIAIVGRNGAGKSTFVKLALGLYRPSRGRILLDGRDLREWDPNALSKRFSVLFQDFIHYQLQAAENIGFGDVTRADDEASWARAAERALVHDLLLTLPHGYRTQLGHWFEAGHELSLGEWQKLALARFFMREGADILVLDEPTASIDAEAEGAIFEQFREYSADRSAILISHRLSTVRIADEILVFNAGSCVERGSHAELLEKSGEYAKLFRTQAEGYQ